MAVQRIEPTHILSKSGKVSDYIYVVHRICPITSDFRLEINNIMQDCEYRACCKSVTEFNIRLLITALQAYVNTVLRYLLLLLLLLLLLVYYYYYYYYYYCDFVRLTIKPWKS
jgi:hypothetical protein